MALRYFRKNKKMTKWIYIGLTVVVMFTFSVTGSLYDLVSGGHDMVMGSFTTPGGTEVVVHRPEWQRWNLRLASGRNARVNDDDVWQIMMLDAAAREAGVNPTEGMIAKTGKMMFGADFTDEAQMKVMRQVTGLPSKELIEYCRAMLRIQLYMGLVSGNGKAVLSEQVYDRFKRDHELFTVDAVSIADADKVAGLDKAAVSVEDLQTFLDKDLPAVRRENEFSTPMKFVLDAAVLSVKDAKIDDLVAKLTDPRQKEVTDVEIQEFYDSNTERFERPKAKPEEPKKDDAKPDETKPDEPKKDEPKADDKKADPAKADEEETEAIPLAEVKDQIKTELLVARVINAAAESYRAAHNAEMTEQAKKKLEEQIKKDEPADPTKPPVDPAKDETAKPEDPPKADLLEKTAKEFGLEWVVYPDARALDELGKLDKIGGGEKDDDLEPFVRGLSNGEVTTRAPTAKIPYGFILRVKDRVQPQVKPIAEIEAKLRDAWLEEKSKKAAETAANALNDALVAKAKEKVAADVAKREQEAKDAATKRIEVEKVTDEARKVAIQDEELAKVKPAIDDLIASHKGEVFDEVMKAAGVAITSIPEFRKSYRTTMFYSDDEPSPEKFVKGYAPLFNLAPGSMIGPVRDDMNKGFLFAIVRSKRDAPYDTMRPFDRLMAESSLQRDPSAQRNAGEDFSFPALAQKFNLKRPAAPKEPQG